MRGLPAFRKLSCPSLQGTLSTSNISWLFSKGKRKTTLLELEESTLKKKDQSFEYPLVFYYKECYP